MIRYHRMRCHSNDRDILQLWLSSNPCCKGQTVFRSKLYVEQDGVRRLIPENGKSLFQALGRRHFEPFDFQPVTKQLAVGQIVFDHQYAMLQDFSVGAWGTTRCNCRIKASCHRSCLWKRAAAFIWR